MIHFSKRFSWSKLILTSLLLVFMASSLAFGAAPPEVNVMPDGNTDELAYAWAGNSLTIWGNVNWGDSATGTYEWDINNDGTPDYSGAVSNAKDIACTHAYTVSKDYDAKLTVTDGNGESNSAIVRIRVLPSVTKNAQIQLAIERGLKWLYLKQGSNGSIYSYNSYSSAGAETAAAVLAFENREHKPCTHDWDMDGDVDANDRAIWEKDNIYAKTVHKGLDYAISTLAPQAISTETSGYSRNPEEGQAAPNSLGIRDSNYNRAPYKIGMYMMALVGAGDSTSGAPDLVATTGPANVNGRTYREIVQDMVDWCAWSQVEPNLGGYRGGWRYYRNYSSSDNSACQWPVIGMEAAEFGWGCLVPDYVKTENDLWINYSQCFTGYESHPYYGGCGYTSKGTGAARTGSGVCQLSFQGKVKDHPRILAAAKRIGNYDKGTGNMYDMYAICKGCRIAKIDTNFDGIGDTYSEIQTLDSWDWYDEYSTYLLAQQYADGHWYRTYRSTFDTAWAVEILTKNVFTLRPIADIEALPNPTPAEFPVDFDISGSFHQDSTKNLVDWWIDVENDGTFDMNGSFPVTGTIPYGGYPDTGSDHPVTARLRVSDSSLPVEYGEDLLVINVVSGNVPPVADPNGPYKGVVGSPITFDGSASYDPNAGQGIPGDHIVSWEWDLDGNGAYDDASGVTVSHTWSSPYQGNIGLKVTDDAGMFNTAATYTEVFVVDLWPENYVTVSRTRISRFVYEYEYQFDMRNRGTGDAFNVECTIDSVPAQITVVDDHVDFGEVPAGTVVTSLDTFKFRQDRRYPVADFQIRWKLEYDDVSGTHVTFLDFPLR